MSGWVRVRINGEEDMPGYVTEVQVFGEYTGGALPPDLAKKARDKVGVGDGGVGRLGGRHQGGDLPRYW